MLETERRKLSAEPENTGRNLELAAYFTHCDLQTAHAQLALRSAMVIFAKAGNSATAAVFAKRLIDSKPSDTKVISSVSDGFRYLFVCSFLLADLYHRCTFALI